ncbi:uncharacterized protein LOC106761698 [Vigna radiata var. radiata]|uniref:Uncharacterized protein LOC106761698 n=1 Tax=Vigna radiata var. radiata TaxID=3916 RepID=A0A3Q0EXP4_VIGRR|nr:uncharacterized protein LOC106761698 [Vigna radiata var. radiata]
MPLYFHLNEIPLRALLSSTRATSPFFLFDQSDHQTPWSAIVVLSVHPPSCRHSSSPSFASIVFGEALSKLGGSLTAGVFSPSAASAIVPVAPPPLRCLCCCPLLPRKRLAFFAGGVNSLAFCLYFLQLKDEWTLEFTTMVGRRLRDAVKTVFSPL